MRHLCAAETGAKHAVESASKELLPAPSERQERPRCLRLQLTPTRARAPRELATDVGPNFVGTAHETPGDGLDAERATMAIYHAHVGTILIEPDELPRSIPQPGVIIARDPYVAAEQREATRATG
jgi:hypothetical protein